MVRAILDGRKTQTRRIVKPQPPLNFRDVRLAYGGAKNVPVCKYGQPGDRLWVKETHTLAAGDVLFRATDLDDPLITPETKWKPSIFMRRKYSRITLEIVSVRVERLQGITEDDAIAEGIYFDHHFDGYVSDDEGRNYHGNSAVRSYEHLWHSINGPESWAANSWVWVIEFRKI